MLSDEISSELNALCESRGGILIGAKEVLAFAEEQPQSAIGKRLFAKTDKAAAREWRLGEARTLIRLWYEKEPQTDRRIRAAISVPSDRTLGAYRRTTHALADTTTRAELVEEALKRIGATRSAYGYLPELGGFFDKLDALIAETRATLAAAPRPRAPKMRRPKAS